jgi:hypothetical protein
MKWTAPACYPCLKCTYDDHGVFGDPPLCNLSCGEPLRRVTEETDAAMQPAPSDGTAG